MAPILTIPIYNNYIYIATFVFLTLSITMSILYMTGIIFYNVLSLAQNNGKLYLRRHLSFREIFSPADEPFVVNFVIHYCFP